MSLRTGGEGCPQPNKWASASEDWSWVGIRVADIQGSAAICPLYQVKIQPFAHDPNVPTLEALIGVPVPQSEGPITHTWAVQMVSAARRRGLWG